MSKYTRNRCRRANKPAQQLQEHDVHSMNIRQCTKTYYDSDKITKSERTNEKAQRVS